MTDLVRTPITDELVRGALELEPTSYGVQPRRLPLWTRTYADPGLTMAEGQPSGVRVGFRTAARVAWLEVVPTKQVYVGAPRRDDGIYDVFVDGTLVAQPVATEGHTLTIDIAAGTMVRTEGRPTLVDLGLPAEGTSGAERDVEVWLPWNEQTELVALHTDAPVSPLPDSGRPVWLHHGSSISHGSDSASPSTTWPAVASRLAGVDLINLGFGGNALLDPFVARVIRDVPADRISLKFGINIVGADLMLLRAFTPAVHGFLDLVRDGHPDTPILLVSAILCPMVETTPGPTESDLSQLAEGRWLYRATGDPADVATGHLTLEVTRAALAQVVEVRNDPHLSYLDGRELYGDADTATHPLPDDLHPDPATQALIGERFARHPVVRRFLGDDRSRATMQGAPAPESPPAS